MFREDRRVACDKVRISLIILDATALGAVLLITTGVMLIFVRPVRLIYYIRAVLYTTHIIVCMVVHLCHVTIAVCRRCTHFMGFGSLFSPGVGHFGEKGFFRHCPLFRDVA